MESINEESQGQSNALQELKAKLLSSNILPSKPKKITKPSTGVKKFSSKGRDKENKKDGVKDSKNVKNVGDAKKSKTKKKTITKPKPKTTKKSTSSENEEIDETDITSRKWEDSKGKNLNKGPYTQEDEQKVISALLDFAYTNKLDSDQLISLVTEKQTKKEVQVWTKIAECLPDRSVQSIHNFCHRKINPYNYKGEWTDKEIQKLILLNKDHGAKWELIGKELERTATNVKDKFKQIGGKNYKKRENEFTLVLCLKLLKYVQNWISDQGLEIFKYTYKFKKDLEDKCKSAYFISEEEKKFLIDSTLKESPSRVIIKNILKKLINLDVLAKIVEDKIEISWNSLAEQFITYSAQDCKNNFEKILRDFDFMEKSLIKKDLKMVKQ
jgi:hypothetical protein